VTDSSHNSNVIIAVVAAVKPIAPAIWIYFHALSSSSSPSTKVSCAVYTSRPPPLHFRGILLPWKFFRNDGHFPPHGTHTLVRRRIPTCCELCWNIPSSFRKRRYHWKEWLKLQVPGRSSEIRLSYNKQSNELQVWIFVIYGLKSSPFFFIQVSPRIFHCIKSIHRSNLCSYKCT
jgi:hypothetical protein